MAGYDKELEKIKTFLKDNPKGMTVSEISEKLDINRNSVAKYLDVLASTESIEMKQIGPAKLYFLSQRVPLSAMLNFSFEFIIVLNHNKEVIQVSDNFAEFLGENKNELVGKKAPEINHCIFKEKELVERIEKAKEDVTEISCIHKSQEVHFKTKFIPTVFEDGSSGLSIIFEDITEAVNAEIALKESEEKFRNIAENSPNMIFINKGGRVVFANKRCEDMGYTREEFYSDEFDFMCLIASESNDLIRQNLAKHMSGKDVDPYEYTLLKKDGTKIESIINAKLIQYESDYAILGIITDITDRKRYEQALRNSENIYKAIMNNVTDPIFVIDKNHRFTMVNSALVELNKKYGFSTKIIGKKIFEIYGFLPIVRKEEYDRILKTKKEEIVENTFDVNGKKMNFISHRIPLIKDNNVCELIVILKDIKEI